jgi:hypothetical protein
LVIRDCALHERDGQRWVQLPARPVLGADGRQLTSPKTQKPAWSAVLEIPDHSIRARFQTAALTAVDRMFEREGGP